MPDTPTLGRYAEIPYYEMTPEQQEGYRSLIETRGALGGPNRILVHNPKLAAEDDRIGGFYLTQGDYKGAYARYKEATQVNPGDADAVFGLAEAARGLKQTAEARDNYELYLAAVPDGSKAKAAHKALAGLGPAPAVKPETKKQP